MKEKKRRYWLYLHPYNHVEIKKSDAVIYNTLNRQLLAYKNNRAIAGLIKRLNSDKNLYVIKIREEDIDPDLNRFINDIRASYSGDIIDISHRPNKPVQLKPILSLQKTFDEITIGKHESRLLSKDEVKDYLNVINLYINERCDRSCRICKHAYRQFQCCTKNNDSDNELSIDTIKKLLDQTMYSKLYKINILGGNVFKHSKFDDLVKLLNTLHLKKEYHVHYLNFVDYPLFQDWNNQLSLIVDLPLDIDGFKYCMDLIKYYKIKKRIHFVIEESGDIQKVEAVISAFGITDFAFAPLYNGDNLEFFKENVFLDEESLTENRLSMNEIFTRLALNTQEFKALTVLCNKKVYANLNNPAIGILGRDHILDIVYKELHQGKSWTKIRKHVNPCKSCVFNALCPPISNYEYTIGKYDLCYMSPLDKAR